MEVLNGGLDVEDLGRPSVAHGGTNQGNLEIGFGNKKKGLGVLWLLQNY